MHRGARGVRNAALHRHARTADRPRHRRARRGHSRSTGPRVRLPPHARRARLAHHRARHGATGEPAARDPRTRECGHRRRGRNGADPARALRSARAARGRRHRGASGGSARHLGRRRPPSPRCPRALPRVARPRLAGAGGAVRGALRHTRVPSGGGHERDHGSRPSREGDDALLERTAAGSSRAPAARSRRVSATTAFANANALQRSSRSREPARTPSICGTRRIVRGRAVVSPRGRRDHVPHRRRPRGRP